MKLPIPVICECGFSTMDAKRAYDHAMTHEAEEENDPEHYCPKCGQAWIVHDGDGSCVVD